MNNFLLKLKGMNNRILKPNCSWSSIGRVGGAHHLPKEYLGIITKLQILQIIWIKSFFLQLFFKSFACKENF